MGYSEEKEKFIVDSYLAGKYLWQIARSAKISFKSVKKILYKHKIEIRPRIGGRKNFFNQNIFEELKDEKTAYWFGFICADGYVNKNGYSFGIQLSIKDSNHLQKLAIWIGEKTKITFRDSPRKGKIHKSCVISVNSKKVCADLAKLGCENNKSLTLMFPNIPEHLLNHFVRGYFDGDGHISKRLNHSCIVGAPDFIEELKKRMEQKCIVGSIVVDKKIKGWRISGLETLNKFYHWLYKDSTVWLERKREVFESKPKFSKGQLAIIKYHKCKELKALGLNNIQIGEKLNFSANQVSSIIYGGNKREKYGLKIRIGRKKKTT